MAPHTHAVHRVSLDQARRHWFAATGLTERVSGSVADVLRRHGYLRTLGGVDSYLMLHARSPELGGPDMDRALDESEIAIAPGPRGCMYYVNHDDFDVCLRVADDQSRQRIVRELARLDFGDDLVGALGVAIEEALSGQALNNNALRKRIDPALVPSFGEVGKKLGLSSPLGSVLRLLELDGRVVRRSENGRLDSDRYLWSRRPSARAEMGYEQALRALVARFVAWCGPVSMTEIADWTGTSQRDVRKALDDLDVLPVAIDGHAAPCWVAESQLDALLHRVPAHAVAFVPFEDLTLVAHGGTAPLTDASTAEVLVPQWGSKGHLVALSRCKHIGLRCILVDGRIVGFWEFDLDEKRVEFRLVDVSAATPATVEAAAEQVTAFIAERNNPQAMSIDSDSSVRRRLAALRSLSIG